MIETGSRKLVDLLLSGSDDRGRVLYRWANVRPPIQARYTLIFSFEYVSPAEGGYMFYIGGK